MSRDINPFGLRMPLDLRGQVTDAAQANGRSLNAEIVARLQDSFERERHPNSDALLKKVESLYEKLEKIMTRIDKDQDGQAGN